MFAWPHSKPRHFYDGLEMGKAQVNLVKFQNFELIFSISEQRYYGT